MVASYKPMAYPVLPEKEVCRNIKEQVAHHTHTWTEVVDDTTSKQCRPSSPPPMGSGSNCMALPKTQGSILTSLEKYTEQIVDGYRKYEWHESKEIGEIGCLEWWKQHEQLFPKIVDIARRHLLAQCSSACSEQSFSKAGLIVIKQRMLLAAEHVDATSLIGWTAMAQHKESKPKREKEVGLKRRKVCTQ